MKTLDKISNVMSRAAASTASLAKVALLSRRPTAENGSESGEIVVLGNGPSLRETIDRHGDWLSHRQLMAVNFAANAPDFRQLRPGRYILADPHFFEGTATDPNVASLWKALRNADWPINLYVPAPRAGLTRQLAEGSECLSVKTFNLTPAEGFRPLTRALFGSGAAMPRPRNVLIPALMIAVRAGFDTVYVAGADHSWTRTLDVDDSNTVISIQPHFYEDNESEKKRVSHEYKGYRLHQILESLTIAFRSYFAVNDFAQSRGTKIINITPGSMIDAFPRLNLNKHTNKSI